MLFWTIVKVAIKSLFSSKLRSFLAVLGIIIGVGAVISMLAIAGGAQKQVMDSIAAMGTNLLVIGPNWHRSRGVVSGTQQNLTLDDAKAVLSQVEGVLQIAPVVAGNLQIKYYNKNSQPRIMGTTITYFPVRNYIVEKGRSFTESEVNNMAKVVVLGPVTAENLFGVEDPIDKVIKIKGINFKVVGVLKSKGQQGHENPDDRAIVPLTTAMKQLFGVEYLREIDVQAMPDANLDEVKAKCTTLLRKRHRTQEGMDDDFQIFNQAEIVETASSFTRTFTILLGGIASISLLVGGIGIMNIMLVTVTERTREIGIRKAIGAKDSDILLQFLIESVIMSGLGGLLGMIVGIGIATLISKLTQFITIVTPFSIFLALFFSASVGIFFGFYPAKRAAKLDPIEALRYE